MRLYACAKSRLYINAAERARFIVAAEKSSPVICAFCLTLLYTGCRISEAISLLCASLQPEDRLITIRTLKRRNLYHIRELPVPEELMTRLVQRANQRADPAATLWANGAHPVDRITAYRWVKQVMAAAEIAGPQACPKGLRHGYGIHAIRSGVPLNMLSKWMGHASLSTTAIYTNAVGAEELAIADRMWNEDGHANKV